MRNQRSFHFHYASTVFLTAALSLLLGLKPAAAQTAPIRVELNKLEQIGANCRAYMVVDNQSAEAFRSLKLDLVMFQTDGIIGRRFALNLAPVSAKKRIVKLFDMDGLSCDTAGSFLINEVVECKTAEADVADCLDRLTVSSLAKAQLTK